MIVIGVCLVFKVWDEPELEELKAEPIATVTECKSMHYSVPAPMVTRATIQQEDLEEEPVDEIIIVGSVNMKANSGYVSVDPIEVNVDDLVEVYTGSYEIPEWDYKKKIGLISTVWEFLVNQQNVEPHNAACIIGVLSFEGNFGEHQGDYEVISSIEDARDKLGSGGSGYGIVQWTYCTRQKALLNYYELANELYPDDFETASVIAECCMLLRELETYQIFDDFDSYTTFEDTVGRLCCCYEQYNGCTNQWSCADGVYTLISQEGSGYARLDYAKKIYEHFMETT
jgi:hypothetical protein